MMWKREKIKEIRANAYNKLGPYKCDED